jgi:hypothetical protein
VRSGWPWMTMVNGLSPNWVSDEPSSRGRAMPVDACGYFWISWQEALCHCRTCGYLTVIGKGHVDWGEAFLWWILLVRALNFSIFRFVNEGRASWSQSMTIFDCRIV